MDHSAFDAYSLLIEADGVRLFYTSDLRAHGRKGSLFKRLLREPPARLSSLLLEGTTLGRPAAAESLSEQEVERRPKRPDPHRYRPLLALLGRA